MKEITKMGFKTYYMLTQSVVLRPRRNAREEETVIEAGTTFNTLYEPIYKYHLSGTTVAMWRNVGILKKVRENVNEK